MSSRRLRSDPAPLFEWQARRDGELLEARRRELRERIRALKPRSKKRIEEEARLRDLTLQALATAAAPIAGSQEPEKSKTEPVAA